MMSKNNFSLEDLISFGRYLLSDERKKIVDKEFRIEKKNQKQGRAESPTSEQELI